MGLDFKGIQHLSGKSLAGLAAVFYGQGVGYYGVWAAGAVF